nr:antitoxin Xre/MbcA/ParS toxin-binding domain-containing protein [uncultured Pseudomonas sp.]
MSARKKTAPADEAVPKKIDLSRAKVRDLEAALDRLIQASPVTLEVTNGRPRMVSILLADRAGDDRMAIYRAVKNGFPLQSVLDMIDSSEVYKQRGVLSKIVGASDRTLARRLKTPNEVLTPEQSTRALNYAEVFEKATQVLGSRELAEQWIVKPARGLDGEIPIDLIANSVGYELVNDFLIRMEYGVY